MKIGVSGASGHLGTAVVSELLQRPGGHEVAAITRMPETVSGPAQGRFGDYNRPESLADHRKQCSHRLRCLGSGTESPRARVSARRTYGR